MIDTIPFSIPDKFASGIADGSLLRFGTVIKDASSGHIIAHVQETGLVKALASNVIGTPFSPVAAVSSIGANVQLAAISKMMVVMQMLQFANLGATLVGIGVSAVGFKAMNTRFTQTQLQIKDFSENVVNHFQELKAKDLREHQSRVNSLLSDADLAHSLSNAQGDWLRVSHSLAEEAAFYCGEVEYLIHLPTFDSLAFRTLVQLQTICNSARIKCLMLADELRAARELSHVTAKQYNLLFDHLSPIELAKKTPQLKEKSKEKSKERSESQEYIFLKEKHTETKQLVRSIRDAQDSALTRPMLIDTLIEKGISGRAFVNQLEAENEHPILCLVA